MIQFFYFFIIKIKHSFTSSFERIIYEILFFASFIVFCVWLGYEIHKRRNAEAKNYEAFWDREHAANSTRRKSLDGLPYIAIPVETFPFGLLSGNEQVLNMNRRSAILHRSRL